MGCKEDSARCTSTETEDWLDEQDGERCTCKEPVDLLDEPDVSTNMAKLELVGTMETVDELVVDSRICKLGEFYISCTETVGGRDRRSTG